MRNGCAIFQLGRVGGIALVEERKRRGESRIEKISVEFPELTRAKKSFVNHRARRQRTEVDLFGAFGFGALAKKVEEFFENGRRWQEFLGRRSIVESGER
jgi:hypothetical protein